MKAGLAGLLAGLLLRGLLRTPAGLAAGLAEAAAAAASASAAPCMRGWHILLATSLDGIQLKKRGFECVR